MSSVINTKMSSNNQKIDDDGYASDATASIFDPDDSDGESMSGDELDEVENIARVIRPQYVSDESIYTPVSSSATTSSRKRNNINNQKNKGVLDYRTMTQQKARDEFIRATTGQEPVPPATLGKVLSEKNNQQQSQGPDVSKSAGGYKREIVPEAAKNAFARDKNPKPLMIDIGSITAQVENARQKKREADDEERKRLATLNNNNGYGFRSGADNNNNNNHANDESTSRTQVDHVASPKSMAPSELAKAIFIHNNNFHGTQEKANNNKNNNNDDDNDDDDSQELTVEENGDEEVAVGQEEELDDRQEYYQFLDAIVKTSKNESERKTFRVPFSDESSTVAGKCAEIDWETREKGLRALNERNAKMHAAFARLGNSSDDTNSARRTTVTIPGHSQKSASSHNNNNKSSSNGVSMGTSTADDEENGIIGSSSRLSSDLAFQQARALLEGMLLEDKFIDAVNNLLERAAPAFRYTKYTRMAGEFTLEQHRQWENYCQIIEHLILKKLHKIMDITDFFQRVFDEEDKVQKENDNGNDDGEDDEEDEYDAQYSSTSNNVLTHDAWELLLSVMKFEAFCSLVDSYIESATELEMMSMVAPESKSAASSTTTTTTAGVAKANPVNASKAKPALFHALPRSGTKALSGGEDASSSSSGSNALINRQKMQAPRSAGSTPIVPKQGTSSQVQQQLSTSSSISGRTPTTNNNNNVPKVLGARNTTNK